MTEPGFVPKTVTCGTAGCVKAGAPVDILVPEDQNPPNVQCGACGQPITDVKDVTPR